MKYYLHDTNARNDERVMLLFIEFGYEGVGLFYSILEVLAGQEKPVNEKVLKAQLGIRKKLEKQLQFMYKIGILSIQNGDVFNENILNFSENYQIKKENTRKKVAEWRKNQKNSENVTSYVSVSNPSKVKESKVKESKVNISFDIFWDLYDKKVDKEKAINKWNKLTNIDRQLIIDYIPAYIKSQPENKYRKNPTTFLNNKSWENELIKTNNNGRQDNINKEIKRILNDRNI